MRALVVDDERVARGRLRRLLERLDVEVVGEARDGEQALEQIETLTPDVAFLDIRMPEMDGLEVARRLPSGIQVVFTTAYDEYAVQAFEASAIDYLLKPVELERLMAAVEKVRGRQGLERREDLERLLLRITERREPPRISARRGNTLRVFDPREIPRFHAQDRYTVFRHGSRDYLLEESIASLEKRLGDWGFVRVHRAELIQLGAVRALKREDDQTLAELVDGQSAVVSRRHLTALKKRLGIPAR